MLQVREVQQELRNKGSEVDEMVAAAEVKDADNTRLWDQVSCHLMPFLAPRYAVSCCAVLCHALPCHAMLCHAVI